MKEEGDAAASAEAGGVAHEADQRAGPTKKPGKKRGAAQMCPGIGIIRSKSGRPVALPPTVNNSEIKFGFESRVACDVGNQRPNIS